jgi:hypothetical protein
MAKKKSVTVPEVTADLKSAVETYLLAKAYCETVRPVVIGNQQTVLNSRQWPVDPEHADRWDSMGETYDPFVTKPDEDYLIDRSLWADYHEAVYQLNEAAGLHVDNYEYCPLLIAKRDLTDASWAVVDASEYIGGVNRNNLTYKYWQQYIDLTVSFVLSMCPEIDGSSLMAKVS